jgi:hypothetical protein
VVEHGGLVLGLLVSSDLLEPRSDVGLVYLVKFGERPVFANVFLLELGELGCDDFQLVT